MWPPAGPPPAGPPPPTATAPHRARHWQSHPAGTPALAAEGGGEEGGERGVSEGEEGRWGKVGRERGTGRGMGVGAGRDGSVPRTRKLLQCDAARFSVLAHIASFIVWLARPTRFLARARARLLCVSVPVYALEHTYTLCPMPAIKISILSD